MPRGKMLKQGDLDIIKKLDSAGARDLFRTDKEYCDALARLVERPNLDPKTLRTARANGFKEMERKSAKKQEPSKQTSMVIADSSQIEDMVTEAVKRIMEERCIA